jgi:ATP/maltotriose-dependent transcriptional regulator MalT
MLARALDSVGQADAARQEAERAIALLTELHAELEISRARALIEALGTDKPKGLSPHPGVSSHPAESGDRPSGLSSDLTGREIEVLKLVANGLSNQSIGEQLFLSEHTVHRHLANIFSKLSVSSRAAAVAQAARRGLL